MFVRKENIPRVTMFRGSAKIFKTGFKRIRSKVKAIPPRMKVKSPPPTLTPGNTWVKKKIEKELNKQFLKNDFTLPKC